MRPRNSYLVNLLLLPGLILALNAHSSYAFASASEKKLSQIKTSGLLQRGPDAFPYQRSALEVDGLLKTVHVLQKDMDFKTVIAELGAPDEKEASVGVESFLGLPIGVDRGFRVLYYTFLSAADPHAAKFKYIEAWFSKKGALERVDAAESDNSVKATELLGN